MQKMLSYVRRAVDHYHMIDEGDRIAVGVSGGKDSLALLVALSQLSRFYPHHFTVVAITLEMGYDEMDFSPVQTLCDKLGVEYIRVPTQIGPIVFDIRHEENPCSLCAKLRRGALHDADRKTDQTSDKGTHQGDQQGASCPAKEGCTVVCDQINDSGPIVCWQSTAHNTFPPKRVYSDNGCTEIASFIICS